MGYRMPIAYVLSSRDKATWVRFYAVEAALKRRTTDLSEGIRSAYAIRPPKVISVGQRRLGFDLIVTAAYRDTFNKLGTLRTLLEEGGPWLLWETLLSGIPAYEVIPSAELGPVAGYYRGLERARWTSTIKLVGWPVEEDPPTGWDN